MPSPFDINPMDPSGMTGFLDTPEIRRQRMFDTLGGISAAILRASAPSMTPMDIGSIAAAGLAGGATAGQGAEDRYLKRAMVGSQVAKNQSEIANEKKWADMFGPGTGTAGASSPVAGPQQAAGGGPMAREKAAIGAIEGDYGSVGPVTTVNGKPSRGYGKYQVMDFNVGPWTQEVLGAAMTPEQFLASKEAQDKVFEVKFGQSIQKYGNPQDAASVWFSGKPLAGNTSGPDVLGTTVAGYVNKFNRGYYGPQQAAGPSVAPDSVMPGAPMPPQTQVAGGPVIPGMPIGDQPPRADGSGNPIQPAQYQPPQALNVPRPQSMQDVINTMPPGVRQMVGAMGRKDGMAVVMKYADPGSEAVLDTQSGSVVFIPKTMVGRDPRYQPVEGAKLDMDRERLAMDRDKAKRDEANAKITVGPGGQPAPNETMLAYEKRMKALEDEFKQAEEKRKVDSGKSEKDFTQEKAIRNEYETQPAVKSYRTVVPMMESAKDAATRPTRAADLNLVYAFAKLMDPDSVVRESETAGVVATASVADRLGGYINQLNGQAMLSPETRAKLLDELNSRFVSLKESNDVLAQQYSDIATAYGLDPSRVVIPIRAPGRGPGGNPGSQPTQEELKGWAANPNAGGARLQFVPGKGVVPR